MNMLDHNLATLSYILQAIGFLGILYAWGRALQELRRGGSVPQTRRLMFFITSVALSAYIVPTLIAICFFVEGCFRPIYRDYLRLFSGFILFLYGSFTAWLYLTKEAHFDGRQEGI